MVFLHQKSFVPLLHSHLCPQGRGRASEGEEVRKLRFFSDVRTSSP
jgi:hypothetical protein